MHEITVRHEFCAAHSIRIAGIEEPVHGHNWRVRAVVRAEKLDSDGLVCDFHSVHAMLLEIVAPFENRSLNEVEPFNKRNPTAELLAEHIATRLHEELGGALGPHARVAWVGVTEAPGCEARYYLSHD